jgi:hypothetical protein
MDTAVFCEIQGGASEPADTGFTSFTNLLIDVVELDVFLCFSFPLHLK